MQARAQSRIVKFGIFAADLEAGELYKGGLRQKVTGQPFEVLRLLLEHPQQIVTREELRQRIWPQDTFVDYDLALRKAITRLRDVLGDSAESPRFIETIPRKGYRFIAQLNVYGESATAAEVPSAKQAWWRGLPRAIAVLIGVVVILGIILALSPSLRHQLLGRATAPHIRSLAVLPLENLSTDPTQEYFSDGMTDALITDLAQMGELKVISRTSTMQYKQTKKSLPQIARELNVDGIVEGTVQRSGDRVRITAQLIHGPSDKHLWANSYERDMRDIFALEHDVAEDIARQIQVRLTSESLALRTQPQPVRPAALEAYLQGRYHLDRFGKGSGDEEKTKAAEYFQQAIDADPKFALAYKGLADSHYSAWPTSQDAAIVISATRRALELDPNFADARVILADVKFFHDWDFRGGEEEVRRALALSPSNATVHSELCAFLYFTGRSDEALRECRISQELDPGDHQLDVDTLYWAGKDDQAIALARMLLQTNPDDGFLHHALYRYYARKGMYKEASQEAERSLDLFGDPDGAARVRQALATSGGRAGLRQFAHELEHWIITKRAYVPGNTAATYAILGDKNRAFHWLEDAYKHHDLRWLTTDIPLESLKSEPMFDSLHSDPRFKDLLRRIGLAQ